MTGPAGNSEFLNLDVSLGEQNSLFHLGQSLSAYGWMLLTYDLCREKVSY